MESFKSNEIYVKSEESQENDNYDGQNEFPFRKSRINTMRDFKEVSLIYKRTSINCTYNQKLKMMTIVIPFNENINKYTVQPEEIDFFDNKDYILVTIDKFNQIFSLEKNYVPIPVILFFSIIYFILSIVIIYCSTLVCLVCLLNPMVILVFILIIMKIIKILIIVVYGVKEKYKIHKIKKALEVENVESMKNFKIIWSYGRDGSWLEVNRKDEMSEENDYINKKDEQIK
jgi:hypothetical protein